MSHLADVNIQSSVGMFKFMKSLKFMRNIAKIMPTLCVIYRLNYENT